MNIEKPVVTVAAMERIKFNFDDNKATSESNSISPSSDVKFKIDSSEYGTPMNKIESRLPDNFNLNLQAKDKLNQVRTLAQHRKQIFA